jgi:hypothetical protein
MKKLSEIFADKTLKAKAKVAAIGDDLLPNKLTIEDLIAFAEKQKPADKATCIEAMEYATKKSAAIANESLLTYVTTSLKDAEPRVKWESARVIANIAKQYPDKLAAAIKNLLANSDHEGTVVRWATATALGEILKLRTANNTKLLPKVQELLKSEEDSGVKKKYEDAVKKVSK